MRNMLLSFKALDLDALCFSLCTSPGDSAQIKGKCCHELLVLPHEGTNVCYSTWLFIMQSRFWLYTLWSSGHLTILYQRHGPCSEKLLTELKMAIVNVNVKFSEGM